MCTVHHGGLPHVVHVPGDDIAAAAVLEEFLRPRRRLAGQKLALADGDGDLVEEVGWFQHVYAVPATGDVPLPGEEAMA